MRRFLAAACAACCGVGVAPQRAAAQTWNDERTLALVQRATERRAEQLADTGLADYKAIARGYLTFLAQLGEGFPDPPQIVKTDQLALQVYWRAPNLSKQVIIGRRDTLMLPTDIHYHNDHLGIIQNNFPDRIRLGEGDEVQDVPHPLSAAGQAVYDYALVDSLIIKLPDREIRTYEVRVRPRNDGEPGVIGAVYVDADNAQVVRMAFSFTRAAYLDKDLEDVSIVLENQLIEEHYWLPSRQEIEIRRTGTWLDYPARGIIRGRWEIGNYQVNAGINPDIFRGPEIVIFPQSRLRQYPWTGKILDSLPPDVRVTTDADVRRVQEQARALVREQALRRAEGPVVSARRVSDIVRVNRVEGLAVGGGLSRQLGAGITGRVGGRFGFSDHEPKGEAMLSWQRPEHLGVSLSAYRTYRDVGDFAEVSLARNSIASQEFGSDWTDTYDARGGRLRLTLGGTSGARWVLEGGMESQDSLSVHATPATGRYAPAFPAAPLHQALVTLSVSHGRSAFVWGTTARTSLSVTGARAWFSGAGVPAGGQDYAHAAARLELSRGFGANALVLETTAAGAFGPVVPPQALAFAGGPITAPGFAFHALVGRAVATQRIEWRTRVPFVSFPVGRFGRVPTSATLAPYITTAWLTRSPDPRRNGWYPSVGVGALTIFELLRVDVARGLRDGRWNFSVDVSRDFWDVL